MITRIETGILPGVRDPRGEALKESAAAIFGIALDTVRAVRAYKIDAALNPGEAERILGELVDPVIEGGAVGRWDAGAFDFAVTVGFRPGVTDNVGRTALTAAGDILGRPLGEGAAIFTETTWLIGAPGLDRGAVETIALGILANPVIHTVRIESRAERKAAGPDLAIPLVETGGGIRVEKVDLSGSDEDLLRLSREGILSLSLEEMKAIRDHFADPARRKERRAAGLTSMPTDAELEALAQTWSEHCKHKIFNAVIRYREPGRPEETIHSLFSTFIQAATEEIAERKPGFLVSVFHDNAGVVRFNERWNLVYKVETHNSPSALDPYGGAITGIVGVNRDPFGTGRGAALLANVWGYCLASPFHDKPLPEGLLHPRRIRDGVHRGVIDGGNQSGIPYARGFEWFDERYLGKPLVFCGTLGLMPREVRGAPAHEKVVEPGHKIVVVGGRVGKDGIHGATFSSEELRKESPVQAVQIGDAFTQKKMTDFLLEARDLGLYTAITDNGAGGLSSSVGEMARITGGCEMDLSLAPLKYAGLQPWEILLSEAQERMTVAVPPGSEEAFLELARARDVEAVILGTFTDSGKFHVRYGEKTVAFIDMDFFHEGCPLMELEAEWTPPEGEEPGAGSEAGGGPASASGEGAAAAGVRAGGSGEGAPAGPAGREGPPSDFAADLLGLLRRLNVCSKEKKARCYDHEVKGLSVVKPFTGVRRDVPADAVVMMVEQGAVEGVVLAEGINPRFSDTDTYWMAAHVIDLAVRRIVAAGGDPDRIAGLDNFCWPDPVQSGKTPDGKYKLAQLVRANKGLYDFTRAFGVPCISGKDSMKNDSVRGGVKISIPPTLLFSAVGKIDDVRRAVTLDFKRPGDAVYVLGVTRREMGGSEYAAMVGEGEGGRPRPSGSSPRREGAPHPGGALPRLDGAAALSLYRALSRAIAAGLVRSAHAPSLGGLGVAFAMSSMAGELGCDVDLDKAPAGEKLDDGALLFSESNARFVVTVDPGDVSAFEETMAGHPCARVGAVTKERRIVLRRKKSGVLLDADVMEAKKAWKSVLGEDRPEEDGEAAAGGGGGALAPAAERETARKEGPRSMLSAAERGEPARAASSPAVAIKPPPSSIPAAAKEHAQPSAPPAGPVRALVITGYGLNCEAETAFALEAAGAAVDKVHLNDIIAGRRSLGEYGLIALIGGFSFGDHIAAGKVYANRLKFQLADRLKEFLAAGNLMIGICNGFQTMAKLGILPGLEGGDFIQRFTLAVNDSGCFRDDWVTVRAEERSPCIFTRGIETVDLPVRHGEGKFFLRDAALLDRMEAEWLVALRYVAPDTGAPAAGRFPYNPNGSLGDVAGVCDPTGRVFGLMPHPEAYLWPWNHPLWPRRNAAGGRAGEGVWAAGEGEGLRFFRNAVTHLAARTEASPPQGD